MGKSCLPAIILYISLHIRWHLVSAHYIPHSSCPSPAGLVICIIMNNDVITTHGVWGVGGKRLA